MIIKNYNNQTGEYFNNKSIVAVYKGTQLVWSISVNSCFGNGYWVNDAPWVNDDAWKNN